MQNTSKHWEISEKKSQKFTISFWTFEFIGVIQIMKQMFKYLSIEESNNPQNLFSAILLTAF